MAVMSAKLGHALVKATLARDLDDAFHKVFSEFLDLKLDRLHSFIRDYEKKWGMSFEEMQEKLRNKSLEADAYSFDTESDYWGWEEAVTLRDHYQNIKNQWM